MCDHAGQDGAVLVLVDGAHEQRARMQTHTSENVIKHLVRVTGGGKKLSVVQRASLRLNESYFATVGTSLRSCCFVWFESCMIPITH